MDILFLGRYNDSECLSGPEKVAKRIFHKAANSGMNVNFIQYYFDGTINSYVQKIFGKEVINPTVTNAFTMGIIRMILYVILNRPKIIHLITFERFHLPIIFIAKFLRIEIFYNVHGIIKHESSLYRNNSQSLEKKNSKVERAIFEHANKLLFLSEESIHIAKKYYTVNENKCVIVPNGIDVQFDAEGIKKSTNDKLNILFSGSYQRPEKGIAEFIKSYSEELDNYNLFIFADSSIYPDKENINIIGKLDSVELQKLYSKSDIIISLGKYEPFSLMVVEAMSMGVVPIINKNIGMKRFITNNENGFKLENSEESLGLINSLSDDRKKLKCLSDKAMNIYEKLNWDKVFNQYLELYKKTL